MRKRSSKLLVTGEFSGVHSEQDNNACTSEQLLYTNLWKDSNLLSNGINDDVTESTTCIKTNPATIASQALYNSGNVTTAYVAVEESQVGQRQSYVVLVGSTVRRVNTKLYLSLSVQNK